MIGQKREKLKSNFLRSLGFAIPFFTIPKGKGKNSLLFSIPNGKATNMMRCLKRKFFSNVSIPKRKATNETISRIENGACSPFQSPKGRLQTPSPPQSPTGRLQTHFKKAIASSALQRFNPQREGYKRGEKQ